MLELPNLSQFKNDPISQKSSWSTMPCMLPTYIPKFDGKLGEDPSTDIMIYHLWCSSNSLMDDSVRFHIFQQSMTRSAAKWYI
jgi:hypothetical protein